ncbi:MAG: hypothetical protein HQM12_09955 [SAR324 cluster bacterium]|nr:hypothetical protein [SAR324 cluster bacterium]
MESLLNEDMPANAKNWIAHAIAGMAIADGHVDSSELVFLKEAMSFLNDRESINEILTFVKQGKVPELPAISLDKNAAFSILKHLTQIAIIDEDLHENETSFLHSAGEILGFPPSITEKFLSIAHKNLESRVARGLLKIQGSQEEVRCKDMTLTGCLVDLDYVVNPMTVGELQVYAKNNEEEMLCSVIPCTVKWFRKKSSGKIAIKLEFKEKINVNHGVLQIVDPDSCIIGAQKELVTKSSALAGRYVQCRICMTSEIPFWSLRPGNMIPETNIFWVPIYTEAYKGKELCNFNLQRITVCPNCFFASDILHFFHLHGEIQMPASFDVKLFSVRWKETISGRKALLKGTLEELLSEKRPTEQAIATYTMAVYTHDLLSRQVQMTFFHQQQSIFYLLIQADLYMQINKKLEAEKNLREVIKRLELIMLKTKSVFWIQAVEQLAMIKLYFQEDKGVSKQLTQLERYKESHPPKPSTAEDEALEKAIESLKQANLDPQSYWSSKRSHFRRNQ